jgi:hypothetical protein
MHRQDQGADSVHGRSRVEWWCVGAKRNEFDHLL